MPVHTKFVVFLFVSHLISVTVPQTSSNVKSEVSEDDPTFFITGGYRPLSSAQSVKMGRHIVSLRFKSQAKFFGENHTCGGSIISARIILTAAHCVYNANAEVVHPAEVFFIVAGSTNRLIEKSTTQVIDVAEIRVHPDYDGQHYGNDIAILRLSKELTEDQVTASSVEIATVEMPSNVTCTVLGWGRVMTYGPIAAELLYADVKIWREVDCRDIFAPYTDGMMCASDRMDLQVDSCIGDSGGPLICDGLQAGIVSFGFDCGSDKYPGFYTNVTHYAQWVEDNSKYEESPFNYILLCGILFIVSALAWVSYVVYKHYYTPYRNRLSSVG